MNTLTTTMTSRDDKLTLLRAAELLDRKAPAQAGVQLAGLSESAAELTRLVAAFLGRKAGSADRYQQRSDPVYQKTCAVQKKLFGERVRLQKIGLLTELLGQRQPLTLLILGIEGDILPRALAAFHQGGGDCSQITVVIVDPIASEIERELRSLVGVPYAPAKVLAFAKPAEKLDASDWDQIGGAAADFVVYALVSLHFICAAQERDAMFRRLDGLGRVQLAMLEHDIDLLHTHSLHQRVEAVWDYFLPQFDMVAELTCTAEERQVLLDRLALMVRDSLSDARDVLCLGYTEAHAHWSARLLAAGFVHDTAPREGDLGQLPGAGITVLAVEDRWPALERPYKFFLVSKNYVAP